LNDKDTLLPCPFCGGEAMEEELKTLSMCWYECEDCGASSGYSENWEQAKKNWNMRE